MIHMGGESTIKPAVWLVDTFENPPFSDDAKVDAGTTLCEVQLGINVEMPLSRPMPEIGKRCQELRIKDAANNVTWRIVYRIDSDAIIVVAWFKKTTNKTPEREKTLCRNRLKAYDKAVAD